MDWILFLEQSLNGLQFGLMLFLLAAGLTLVFGIMDMINLAHGSLYMIGAYFAAVADGADRLLRAGARSARLAGTAIVGMLLEIAILRRLYQRDHLSQVLATFALLLIANEAVRIVFGSQALMLNIPEALAGPVELLPELTYPAYRLLIIAVGLAVAVLLYLLVAKTRVGMLVRAGASNREMAQVMGVNVKRLFTAVFGVGAALCALAGGDARPAAGGAGGHGREHPDPRLRGDRDRRHRLDPRRAGRRAGGRASSTRSGRTLLPMSLRAVLPPPMAANLGPSLASILIYVLMAAVLFWRPQGLFPARGG